MFLCLFKKESSNNKLYRFIDSLIMDDLDAILDDALDEFEEEERARDVLDVEGDKDLAEIAKSLKERPNPSTANQDRSQDRNDEVIQRIQQLMVDMTSEKGGNTFESSMRSIGSNFEGMDQMMGMLQSSSSSSSGSSGDMAEVTAERLRDDTFRFMEEMGEQVAGTESGGGNELDPDLIEEGGETLMTEMLSELEKMGGKEDYEGVVDGIMRQLLSKEIMHEPIKQVVDEFPRWLARKRDALSPEEYQNYGHQYQCFQRLLAVYETEPDNFGRLMELMFEIQQYGQPPAEIIRELAPGLEFDEEGMPVMPNMGANMFPTSEGPGGMPSFMPGQPSSAPPIPGAENCVVS